MNQEGRVISQEREEKYGASFLHRLINEQKVEMEAWICLICLSRRPHVSIFWERELCGTFNYFIIELCTEEKGVGRILEQIILQMKKAKAKE